jgi:hypothetical protein
MAAALVAAAVAALPGPALDPAHLAVPRQGIVARAAGGVVLVDLRGRVLGHLDGFRLDGVAEPIRRPREVLLRKGSGSYALGRNGLRRAPRFRGGWPRTARGCHPAPLPFVICGYPYSRRERPSTVYLGKRRVLAPLPSRYPHPSGYWVGAQLSPDRRTLLLQWSGECEIPTAYLAHADGTGLHPVVGSRGTESLALGWTRSGRAVLDLPRGACGTSFRRPGIYLLDPRSRRAAFVYRGQGRLWGSAFAG